MQKDAQKGFPVISGEQGFIRHISLPVPRDTGFLDLHQRNIIHWKISGRRGLIILI